MHGHSTLDAALEQLQPYGPDLANGFFNHAPMVVEALHRMGHGDRALAWLEAQRPTFTPRPQGIATIEPYDWQSALGDRHRFADWSRFFATSFRDAGWASTLDVWIPRLAPGFVTSASHGVLKTAHAVRALGEQESPARLAELADALAAWAARFQTLPVSAAPGAVNRGALEALAAVPLVPPRQRPGEGPITDGYEAVALAPGFAREVSRLDVSGDPSVLVDDLVVAFAHLFVAGAHSPFTAIVFTHAVTASAAVGHLLPWLTDATGRLLVFRAWEAGCALKTAFAASPEIALPDSDAPQRLDPAALKAAAAEHGDDHVIKLTEACTSTWARRPEPVLLRAAEQVTRLVPG